MSPPFEEDMSSESLRFACAGLEIEALHWWQRISASLRKSLGDRISDDQALAAAMLIYNPYGPTGPSWKDLEKGYGLSLIHI